VTPAAADDRMPGSPAEDEVARMEQALTRLGTAS
jgi:hypothetical protein